jgi:hypothetical protein
LEEQERQGKIKAMLQETPFRVLVNLVENVSWREVAGIAIALAGMVSVASVQAYRFFFGISVTENHVEVLATNCIPHIRATLANIDKNIAKMSGGEIVDNTALDQSLEARKGE